ncbi:unnamed protein product [Rotaria sp. Silwood2]|nr:unnamed protein product [Rotaria sp. Silwood2]
MFSSHIEWNCSQCQFVTTNGRKYCTDCHSMLTWTCTGSGKSGSYNNYHRHLDNCSYCTPELEEEKQQKMEEKRQKNKQHTDSAITPYLSPMNLLVVILWYLKYYHSERYIATELNLGPSTVNYLLSEVVDILHSCVYPELISLSGDMSNRTTPHGPEEHHKLIVDSTFIAISQRDDLDQHK